MPEEIGIRAFPERWVLCAAAATTADDLGDTLADLFPKLLDHANEAGAKVCGVPMTRYGASQADGSMEIEACLPVESACAVGEGFACVELPACRAAATMHHGPYENLGDAHFALGEYVRVNRLETAGECWEEYVNDPGAAPDPSKWMTLVCWPVKPAE